MATNLEEKVTLLVTFYQKNSDLVDNPTTSLNLVKKFCENACK